MPGSWTYDPTLFASTDPGMYAGTTVGVRYQVRFLIRDTGTKTSTGSKPFLMDDAEIDWVQTQEMNVYMMAARCCDELIAQNGAATSRKVGDLTLMFDPKFYEALAASLRARGETYQVPYVGGISIADKLAQEANVDAVPPHAFRDQFNNPGASQSTPSVATTDNPLAYGPGI